MPAAEPRSLTPLTHPVFLVALVVLAANDRLGKVWFPGVVTGKVSDLAGPIVLATVVGVLVGWLRPRAAVPLALTVPTVLMVAAKTSEGGAAALVWVLDATTPWANEIVADPWDLLGLIGLAAVPRILATRSPSEPLVAESPPRSTRTSSNRTPAAARWTILAVGVWACAATSAAPPNVHDRIGLTDDGIVALDTDQGGPALRAPDPNGPWTIEAAPPESALLTTSRSTEICLERSPGVCIRTGPSLRIEESADGGATWRTVWQLDPAESWVGQTRADASSLGADQLEAGEVLELADGRAVVAMGVFEPVSRGVDGVWGPEPAALRDVPDGAWLFLPPTALGLILSLTLVWPSATHVRTRILGIVSTVLAVPAVVGSMYAWLLSPYDGFTLFPFLIVILGTTAIQLLVVLIGWGFRIADADRRVLVVAGLGGTVLATAIVLVLTVVVLLTWQAGAIGWVLTRIGVSLITVFGSVAASIGLAAMLAPAVTEPQEL